MNPKPKPTESPRPVEQPAEPERDQVTRLEDLNREMAIQLNQLQEHRKAIKDYIGQLADLVGHVGEQQPADQPQRGQPTRQPGRQPQRKGNAPAEGGEEPS